MLLSFKGRRQGRAYIKEKTLSQNFLSYNSCFAHSVVFGLSQAQSSHGLKVPLTWKPMALVAAQVTDLDG